MQVLVLNTGSSSMKFSIYRADESDLDSDPVALLVGEITGIGAAHPILKVSRPAEPDRSASQTPVQAIDAAAAARLVFDQVAEPDTPDFQAVGYRVVHPGAELTGHQLLTPEVLSQLAAATSLAPLHDPEVLTVIQAAMSRYPELSHFACFDTEFHRTMPEEASIYAIPKSFRDRGVRRYGFHGLSCESVVHQLRRLDAPFPRRLIIAHLGSGCSVTAVENGRSVDTSMGLTPEGGVVMGTRPGDLDPGLVLFLLRQQAGGTDAEKAVESLLNHSSGMVALSGCENNMQVIRGAARGGDQQAVLALKVFTRSVRKAIGGFAWLLGGVDAIVFTGGIGEHDAGTRSESLAGLQELDVSLDLKRNAQEGGEIRNIEASDSRTAVVIVPAQEDLMIARHVASMMKSDR